MSEQQRGPAMQIAGQKQFVQQENKLYQEDVLTQIHGIVLFIMLQNPILLVGIVEVLPTTET